MNINEAHELILVIESEKDTPDYRLAWGLQPAGSILNIENEFEQNIEDRLVSVVGEYAISSEISWEDANDALILHRIENSCHRTMY